MKTVFIVLEEQSDWVYGGEDECSIEITNTVPVRAFASLDDAAAYIRGSNSELMQTQEVPFGPQNG